MERIIAFYIESKVAQFGVDPAELSEFSLAEEVSLPVNLLPRRLMRTPTYETKYPIIILALNSLANRAFTVGVNVPLKESELCVWQLDRISEGTEVTESGHIVTQTLKQQVEGVCWNFESREEELIATASRISVCIFNSQLKLLTTLSVKETLCCRFNPITNFLYTAGLGSHQLRVWSSRGEELDAFRVGAHRDIVFSVDGTRMYLVSATEPKLTKMETVELEKLAELKVSKSILDCMPVEEMVLLCTKDQLMVLKESNLQVLRTIDLEAYEKDVVYYSYVRVSGPWFIVSDGKHFKSIHNSSQKQHRWNSQSYLPAFDVSVNPDSKIQLVSTSGNSKTLHLWTCGVETVVLDEGSDISGRQDSHGGSDYWNDAESVEDEDEDSDDL